MSNAQVRHNTGLDTLPVDLTAEQIAARTPLRSRHDLIDPELTDDELNAMLDAIA